MQDLKDEQQQEEQEEQNEAMQDFQDGSYDSDDDEEETDEEDQDEQGIEEGDQATPGKGGDEDEDSDDDGGGFGGGGGDSDGGDGEYEGIDVEAEIERLSELLKNTVRGQDYWDEDSGNSLEIQRGNLVVMAPRQVQEEIQDLLGKLRRIKDLMVSVDLRSVFTTRYFAEAIGFEWTNSTRFYMGNDVYKNALGITPATPGNPGSPAFGGRAGPLGSVVLMPFKKHVR